MKFDIAAVKSSVSRQGYQYIKAHGNYQWHDQLLAFSIEFMCLILSALYQTFNFNVNSVLDFNVEEYPLPQIPKILLLYSRDCKQFMEVMITFRELLEEITRCKVGNYSLLTLNASVLKNTFELNSLTIE
jgi:hypothetical protein